MTKDETLKLALEALKQIDEAMPFPVAKLAQKVIKEALAQPEHIGVMDSKLNPIQRKPLTDEKIYSVLENLQIMYNRPPTTDSRIIFARAIEAAHGIKVEA